MLSTPNDELDFEYWAEMAATDPEKFEQMRRDKINELIDKAPTEKTRQRLVGLQWQIDQIRAQHKDSAMASCLAISELMWETFAHLSDLLHFQADNGISATVPPIKDNIIPFPTKPKAQQA